MPGRWRRPQAEHAAQQSPLWERFPQWEHLALSKFLLECFSFGYSLVINGLFFWAGGPSAGGGGGSSSGGGEGGQGPAGRTQIFSFYTLALTFFFQIINVLFLEDRILPSGGQNHCPAEGLPGAVPLVALCPESGGRRITHHSLARCR